MLSKLKIICAAEIYRQRHAAHHRGTETPSFTESTIFPWARARYERMGFSLQIKSRPDRLNNR